eukprot:357877-Prymnesium_polylepis.3
MVRTAAALGSGVLSKSDVLPRLDDLHLLDDRTLFLNDDGCGGACFCFGPEPNSLNRRTSSFWDFFLMIPSPVPKEEGFPGASIGFRATRTTSLPAKMASPGSRSSPPLSGIAIWL